MTNEQITATQTAAFLAVQAEHITGCPDFLTLCQWALESGWGSYAPGNNPFGIKAYDGCYGRQLITTHEYRAGKMQTDRCDFATFPSLAAAFVRHGYLIAQHTAYAPAFKEYIMNPDAGALIANVAKVYATDPGYAKELNSILRMPVISTALEAARFRYKGAHPGPLVKPAPQTISV